MIEGGVLTMQEEKQVKFEKGKVSEYNGQQDIYCDFVTVTEGSKQDVYYLLNDKKLDNGFYIASTVLKEAIDPQILRTHLGVINQKGDIIIPFENKSIKTIEDKYLLVVRSEAKTKSVLDAIASRNDPLSAEKMVNANASIKDKLNRIMNGKFILNDLLSEGTVYTLDGKNIFDNQYYSFIGMTDDSFYCSSNVPESSVAQFPRTDLFAVKPSGILAEEEPSNDKVVVDPVLPEIKPTEEKKEDTLDVTGVSVSKDKIDAALNAFVSDDEKTSIVESSEPLEEKKDEESKDSLGIIPPVSIDKPKDGEIPPIAETQENNDVKDEGVEPFHITDEPFQLSGEEETPVEEEKDPVETDSVSISENGNDNSMETKDMGDVVHAVSDIVQKNKQLEQQNQDLEARISELEKENQNYQAQTQETSRLKDENSRLLEENRKLTVINGGLQNTMNQIRQELGINSVSTETASYEYQKVA